MAGSHAQELGLRRADRREQKNSVRTSGQQAGADEATDGRRPLMVVEV